MQLFKILVLAYFLGAIPFSLLCSKLKGIDLRKVGSGNLGATNVYRAMGIWWALLVFFLDGLKGYIPTMLAIRFFEDPGLHILVGGMAVVGHMFTVFARFKGGKGAATGLGMVMALSPVIFSILFGLAIVLIVTFRYMAPVTILCCALAPILFHFMGYPMSYTVFMMVLGGLIILKHKANIVRLINGEENRLQWKK